MFGIPLGKCHAPAKTLRCQSVALRAERYGRYGQSPIAFVRLKGVEVVSRARLYKSFIAIWVKVRAPL